MNNKSIRIKIELYLLSLTFLFMMVILINLKIPICLGKSCELINFSEFLSLLRENIPSIISIIFLGACWVSSKKIQHKIQGASLNPKKIIEIKDLSYENLSFFITYIIPFSTLSLGSVRYTIVLSFLLSIIGIMLIKTNKFYLNPTLAIFGFRLYSAELSYKKEVFSNEIIITKEKLRKNDDIFLIKISQNIYFARK